MPMQREGHYLQGRVLRGALIGFGNVAQHAHMPAFETRSDFMINAIVETDPGRQNVARSLFPDIPVYARFDDIRTRGDIDFVDICTPPCSHAGLAASARRSGFHVLCEKPFPGLCEMEAENSAGAGRRIMFVVNNWKFSPLWLKIAELVRGNSIGRVREVALNVVRTPGGGGGATDWRMRQEAAGGGILLDHGWHQFYLLLSLIDEAPEAVSAALQFGNGDGPAIDETADITVLFRSRRARIHLTWRGSARRTYGEITGDKGSITFDDDHAVAHVNGVPPARYDFAEPLSRASHHPAWMHRMLDDFYREIADRRVWGVNIAEARQCARLVESTYRSDREGSRWVAVKPESEERENDHASGE